MVNAQPTVEGPISTSAFFYGTLMHPRIIQRVIGNDGKHLKICPAILKDYTRHQLKYADYPAIVPYSKSQVFFESELDEDDRSVRGTLVTGLRRADMKYLDIYEDDAYIRRKVEVHPLGQLTDLDRHLSIIGEQKLVPYKSTPIPTVSELPAPIEVEAYVFPDIAELKAELWSFEDFITCNSWKWIGSGSLENHFYKEVDRARAEETDKFMESKLRKIYVWVWSLLRHILSKISMFWV